MIPEKKEVLMGQSDAFTIELHPQKYSNQLEFNNTGGVIAKTDVSFSACLMDSSPIPHAVKMQNEAYLSPIISFPALQHMDVVRDSDEGLESSHDFIRSIWNVNPGEKEGGLKLLMAEYGMGKSSFCQAICHFQPSPRFMSQYWCFLFRLIDREYRFSACLMDSSPIPHAVKMQNADR